VIRRMMIEAEAAGRLGAIEGRVDGVAHGLGVSGRLGL
jgi:hypothetical protein